MRQGFLRWAAIGIGVVVAMMLAEGVLRLLHLAPADGVATVTAGDFRSIPGFSRPTRMSSMLATRDCRIT